MKKVLTTLLSAAFILSLTGAPLPPVRVEGGLLTAGGREIRLRGINWGWFHLAGTVYTRNEMQRQAQWGANVLRLAFSYFDVFQSDGSWNEKGLSEIDEVIRWAEEAGQYVILDLHLAPGGQNFMPNPDRHRNLLWTDRKFQDSFLRLWRELAGRYRDNPVVAAYELMNEPMTNNRPELLYDLNRRAVAAIREVDPDKVIVLGGDGMSPASSLVDGLKVEDPGILYTFHFYEGAWLGNVTGERRTGTAGWTRLELPVEIPDNCTSMNIMLRSEGNSGSAWFDDVTLADATGKILYSFSFEEGVKPFSMEREPHENGVFDPGEGHSGPGSLRIGGTVSYNSWRTPEYRLKPGKYRITAWMKLENATGGSYLACALFGSAKYTAQELDNLLKVPVAFQRKHQVPVWVGEFSVARSNAPGSLQQQAIADRIAAFERNGFHWTYWNYRETTNPDTMALHAQKKDGSDYPINEMLLKVLKEGWRRNSLPDESVRVGFPVHNTQMEK